jgi:hypothetical protein
MKCDGWCATVVEVYNKKWGPSVCFAAKVQEMYFNNMDKLKFFKVSTSDPRRGAKRLSLTMAFARPLRKMCQLSPSMR